MGIRQVIFARQGWMLAKCALVAAMALAFGRLAEAQSFLGMHMPEAEVFGGYSVLRYDTQPLGFAQRLNLNGGNLELSLPNLYQGLGVVADFSGHYSSEMQSWNFLGGAQYRYEVKGFQLFGHFLGGKTRTRLNQLGTSQFQASTLGGTVAFGGGVDYQWTDRISIRPVQADYMLTSAYGDRRHNVRYSAGIVFRFGKRSKRSEL